MIQNIFILGSTGNVGKELVRQIQAYDISNNGHLNPTRIVGIANSRSYTLNPNGIENLDLNTPYSDYQKIIDNIRKSGLEGDIIFVDVTAEGNKMIDFHKMIIEKTANKIVTANKKPLVEALEVFQSITADPNRYRYNASVMAGASIIPYLQEAHGLSEDIISILGTFSGTLSYICSELEKGEKLFSTIVQEAKEKGFTEPNPLDDLSGIDVKNKLIILLRSAGVLVKESNIELKGMVNAEKYANCSPDDFIEMIKMEDNYFVQKIKDEFDKGNVPRYIASYELKNNIPQIHVGLKFVPKESELGRLVGTANMILVNTSQRTPERDNPHVIQSPGAGIIKTAASIRSDLFHLLKNTNVHIHN